MEFLLRGADREQARDQEIEAVKSIVMAISAAKVRAQFNEARSRLGEGNS